MLWRLEQVLGHAATGVRMSDGTTWIKQPGWHWNLGRYMREKAYPGGEAEAACAAESMLSAVMSCTVR